MPTAAVRCSAGNPPRQKKRSRGARSDVTARVSPTSAARLAICEKLKNDGARFRGRMMQDKATAEPSPIFPSLRGFYDLMIPLSWVVVRFGVGWNLAVHGYGKFLRGMEGQAKLLEQDVP